MKMICRLALCFVLFGALFVSCSGPETQVATTASRETAFATAPADRPGLGTKWGETRQSRVDLTNFERADRLQPIAEATIYYNDEAGIRAMAGAISWRGEWPLLSAPANVSVALRDQSGRFLPGFTVGNRWFVVGEEGRR